MRLRRTHASARRLAAGLLLALAFGAVLPAAAPRPDAGTPPMPEAVVSCLDGLEADVGLLPGSIEEAQLLESSRERSVDADRETILRVLAIADLLDEPLELERVLDYREERVEVCAFDRLTSLEAQPVLSSLALGVRAREGALVDLVADRHVVIRFESHVEQEVELKEDVAVAALAFAQLDPSIRLDDVLDIRREVRVERSVVATTDLDRDDALLALALEGDADDGRDEGRQRDS